MQTLEEWQIAQIKLGQAQARAGQLYTTAEVLAALEADHKAQLNSLAQHKSAQSQQAEPGLDSSP